jgi:hypothetical protein
MPVCSADGGRAVRGGCAFGAESGVRSGVAHDEIRGWADTLQVLRFAQGDGQLRGER